MRSPQVGKFQCNQLNGSQVKTMAMTNLQTVQICPSRSDARARTLPRILPQDRPGSEMKCRPGQGLTLRARLACETMKPRKQGRKRSNADLAAVAGQETSFR